MSSTCSFAVDLRVVFELALAFESGVERLAGAPLAVTIRFEQRSATVRQHDRLFAITRDANRLDQPLFSEMAEVAITDVAGPLITIAEVTGPHDAKGADRGQRSTLGSSQRVFTTARIVDHFAVTPARQVQATREHLAWVARTVPRVASRPSGILTIAMVRAVTCLVPIVVAFTFVMGLGRRIRATSKRQPVVIVIPIALVPIAVAWVALVAVVAWIEIHGTSAS